MDDVNQTFARRMLEMKVRQSMTADDVVVVEMEPALYNTVVGGMALMAKHFYVNPLKYIQRIWRSYLPLLCEDDRWHCAYPLDPPRTIWSQAGLRCCPHGAPSPAC